MAFCQNAQVKRYDVATYTQTNGINIGYHQTRWHHLGVVATRLKFVILICIYCWLCAN